MFDHLVRTAAQLPNGLIDTGIIFGVDVPDFQIIVAEILEFLFVTKPASFELFEARVDRILLFRDRVSIGSCSKCAT